MCPRIRICIHKKIVRKNRVFGQHQNAASLSPFTCPATKCPTALLLTLPRQIQGADDKLGQFVDQGI
jgi:hypothetical protein